ncbi:hypothetical protein EDB19DRAFT_837140 [Suillus lakei]|nr:hypothetical protein EDB19DRAFT_837140 [Suillus lakei]
MMGCRQPLLLASSRSLSVAVTSYWAPAEAGSAKNQSPILWWGRADDVATAGGLRFLAYICASMATFWTYDYVCSLDEEWTFLLRSRWTKVKGLYIITRYVPFLLLMTDIYLCFTPDENPNNCRMVINIYSCLSMISVACSEFFFVLRTYALWDNNRIVLAAMLSAFLAVVVASVGVNFGIVGASHVTISAIPGVISLTIIRAMQSWQKANGLLYAVLMKHNIFYYACGLFLSTVNVLTQMLFSNIAYRLVFEVLQFFILAIIATRMHLHLWQINQHAHGSDAFVHIPISETPPSNCTVTMV